jgi:hypothetical protein
MTFLADVSIRLESPLFVDCGTEVSCSRHFSPFVWVLCSFIYFPSPILSSRTSLSFPYLSLPPFLPVFFFVCIATFFFTALWCLLFLVLCSLILLCLFVCKMKVLILYFCSHTGRDGDRAYVRGYLERGWGIPAPLSWEECHIWQATSGFWVTHTHTLIWWEKRAVFLTKFGCFNQESNFL